MEASTETSTRQRRKGSQSSSTISSLPMTNQDSESLCKKRKRKATVAPGSFVFISVFVLLSVSMLFVRYMDARLPKAKLEADEDAHDTFVEERARKDLETLCSAGIRVSGSYATDVVTVANFVRILEEIKRTAALDVHNVEYEVDRPTGAFFLADDEGQMSSYDKISNVVAKVEPANVEQRTNDSILLNCHFDTKPGAPGASDNVISCSVMLELLRVLSRRPSSMKNTIVFLFNGAEELGLQGAHGYIGGPHGEFKGHPWSQQTRAFMNLEGAGAGGREILFQSGPGNSWMMKAYAKHAPHPYGTAIAEEAFQLGLVPSDTDFRVFRDFANRKIPGLDMAFIKNGWVYHTKWDKIGEIPPGSMTNMGENSLGIVEYLGNVDFSEIEDNDTKMVFFDVLGSFTIAYSEAVGMVINAVVSVAALGVTGFDLYRRTKNSTDKRKWLHLLWLPFPTLLGWGVAIALAVLSALFLNACGYYKPFYSYPSLAAVIFGFPAFMGQVLTYNVAFCGSMDKAWLSGKIVIAIVCFVLAFITRAAYAFSYILLFGVVGWYFANWFCRGWPRAIIIFYLIIGEIIPVVLGSYLVLTFADVFVPIMGRSGSETNANLYFGLIIGALLPILIFNGISALFVPYKKSILIVCLAITFFVINPLVVFGFVGKIPYQEKTPMRLNIVDLDRTWYANDLVTPQKSDSGYWWWTIDSNTKDYLDTFKMTVPEVRNITEMDANGRDCPDLYCAQPFLWPTSELIKKTFWIKHEQPSLSDRMRDSVYMTAVKDTSIPRRVTVQFSFHGPTDSAVVLSPNHNYKLVNWTLAGTEVPESGLHWRGRETFFIYHAKGYEIRDDPFLFTCVFEGEDLPQDPTVVTVQLGGFFLYGPESMNERFGTFVNKFPSWTNVMTWSTVLKMYSIVI